MYFFALLLMLAAIAAVIIGIRCYAHYRYPYRRLKEMGKPLSLLQGTFQDSVAKALLPFLCAIIIWAVTILAIGIFAGNSPVFSYHTTNLCSNSQVVLFEKKTNDGYIVSIDGKEYVCDKLVVSNDVDTLQVLYVDCEWSSELMRFFMAGLASPNDDAYELHIPANYLNPTN